MGYKISIIVPVYSVETYIERCAKSLFEQTLTNIEYIFVDDCSPDKSIEILKNVIKQYPNREPHVKILKHHYNKGLPFARKTGLDHATGTYILHTDSDDWMEIDMCERLLKKAEEDDCDMVICDYNKVSSDNVVEIKNCYSENFFDELLKCTITGALWNKLIKRSLFEEHEFIYPALSFCEDYVITIQASYYAGKIGYVQNALYNYANNPTSITQSVDKHRLTKRLDEDYINFKLVEKFLDKQNLTELNKDEIIFHKLKMKNYIRRFIKNNKKYLSRWRNTFPELNHQIFHCKYIGLRLIISYYATWLGLYKGK